VGEERRDVQGSSVLGGQLDRDVLEPGRGARTHVDDDVDDRSGDAAHQLRLGVGGDLEVHATERSRPVVERQVALLDRGVEAGGRELLATERSGEEAAIVLAPVEVDDHDPVDGRRVEDHETLQKRRSST
jgi:hypothetical protein